MMKDSSMHHNHRYLCTCDRDHAIYARMHNMTLRLLVVCYRGDILSINSSMMFNPACCILSWRLPINFSMILHVHRQSLYTCSRASIGPLQYISILLGKSVTPCKAYMMCLYITLLHRQSFVELLRLNIYIRLSGPV